MSKIDDDLVIYTKTEQCFWDWNIITGEIKWTDSIEGMFGLKPGQFKRTYEDFISYIHPDDVQKVLTAVNDSVKNISTYNIDHRIIWPNGEIHWLEEAGEIVVDEKNIPQRMIGSVRNIDHIVFLKENNRILEKQISNQTSMTDALLKGIDKHSLVSITDTKGIITYANDNFCKTSRYKLSELIGKNHNIVNSNHHDKKFWSDFWEKISKGQTFSGVIVNKTKDGELYYVDTTVVPIRSQKNVIYQYISIRTDITHLKRHQDEIEKYSSELEEKVEFGAKELKETQAQLVQSAKLAALGEMSSGLAHELNNPLFLIQGFAETLKEKIELNHNLPNHTDMLDEISEIYQNAIRMRLLIKHFGEFTRLSSEEFESVDIHETIHRSLHFFKEQFRLKEIEVILDLDAQSSNVRGISNRLEQVFVNLLSNSRDALVAKNSAIVKNINIKTMNDKSNLKIIFRDNGIGIAKENLSKIANPFFTTKEVSQGTGLGLSILHSIIDEVSGAVSWRSTKNEYTEFEISIPLERINNG